MGSLVLEVLEGEVQGSTLLSGISLLGRGSACAVVIDDRVVSREHAVIREEAGVGFVLEDLDSRSGTYVNGVKCRKAVLLDGDTIRIGPVSFRVRTGASMVGEVPPEDVKLVESRHLPTQRLTLDAIRFRSSRRYLKDTGKLLSGALEGAGAELASSAPPTTPSDPGDPAATVARRLELLLDITNSLTFIHDPARLGRATASRLLEVFPQARRVGVFRVVSDADGESALRADCLVDREKARAKGTGGAVRISQSVLQTTVDSRKAILSEDVHLDERFQRSESLETAGVCSILSAPILLGERILGVLYVDSTDADRRFDEGSLRVLTGVAGVLASAYENARLFSEVQKETHRRASLERYFSPDLVERVLRGELPLAREGRQAHGTILFVDIRGFTRMTLETDPQVLVATLNAYFETMQRIIFRTRGTVERFGGDSILAYWGIVDQDPQAAAHALRAALAMQVEVFRLNPQLMAEGKPPLQVGIGLESGTVVAGDVGSAERHEFTILGDAVNMASRFQGLAGPGEIVAGRGTLAELRGSLLHVPLPPTSVKGKSERVRVSAVCGLRVDSPATRGGLRRYELAAPGHLDLGQGPENTIVSGIEFGASGQVIVEAVSPYDPQPGTPARIDFAFPRSATALRCEARALSDLNHETTMLPTLSVADSELHRLRFSVVDPQALVAALRQGFPAGEAGAERPPPGP